MAGKYGSKLKPRATSLEVKSLMPEEGMRPWVVGLLSSDFVEEQVETTGQDGCRGEGKDPGERDIADGGHLEADLVGRHGAGHARAEHVRGADRQTVAVGEADWDHS